MADFVSAQDMEDLLSIRSELLDLTCGLSDDEIEFLDDLEEWEGCYTCAQAGWLRQIYERCSS